MLGKARELGSLWPISAMLNIHSQIWLKKEEWSFFPLRASRIIPY